MKREWYYCLRRYRYSQQVAHNEKLEPELFNENGDINVDEDGNPLGQWDDYYGENGNIRPYLYYPSTETESRNFVCYKIDFDELPKYGKSIKKISEITFWIMVHGQDRMDKFTGIPRHDLIASIIRQRFNWSSIFGMQEQNRNWKLVIYLNWKLLDQKLKL